MTERPKSSELPKPHYAVGDEMKRCPARLGPIVEAIFSSKNGWRYKIETETWSWWYDEANIMRANDSEILNGPAPFRVGDPVVTKYSPEIRTITEVGKYRLDAGNRYIASELRHAKEADHG